MTSSPSSGPQGRLIPYAIFSMLVMVGLVWVILQRPPLGTMVLTVVAVILLELVGVLWFLGPEGRKRLLPLETARQAITRKWTCASCGTTHPARTIRCEQCGELNPTKIWRCPICEASVTKDLGICPECGTAKPEPG